MPNSDLVVLTGLALGVPISALILRRRGARGRSLFSATWLAFFGLTLFLMMATHSVEVVYNTLRGEKALDGSVWTYNFRVYSLLLLAAVLIVQGIRCLRAAPRLGSSETRARQEALRATLIVLAVTAPLIPVHAFFGVLLSALGVLTLAVLTLVGAYTSD
jgi:hypothetical protein